MKIYFDACVVNRLSDDQSQPRIRAEADAIEEILLYVLLDTAQWIGSRAVAAELSENPDEARRDDSLALFDQATIISTDDAVLERTRVLGALGYGGFDALHLAHAEAAGVDALLTTDDRFMRKAVRGEGSPKVRVVNPIDYLREVRIWHRQK